MHTTDVVQKPRRPSQFLEVEAISQLQVASSMHAQRSAALSSVHDIDLIAKSTMEETKSETQKSFWLEPAEIIKKQD